MNVGVKVMKSFDYCHFEVSLSGESETNVAGVMLADELGVAAQQMCDRQIERYKKHKAYCEHFTPFDGYQVNSVIADIEKIPANERTPEMKALLKARDDYNHWQSDDFDYDREIPHGPDGLDVILGQLDSMVPHS